MAETVIGKTLTVEGEVTGREPLVVLGNVKGKIALESTVTVADGGLAEADIVAANLEIAGGVRGNAQVSERLEIKSGGQMEGDVRAPRILIADGAVYRGNIDMDLPSEEG